jgi:aspartyl-tRNA(Asn)/glutamyl-tRNA(Gln) amidotransferase subunit C
VDTSGVPPTPFVLPLENVMREDAAEPGLTSAVALANALDSQDGFFRVRAVFDEESP